MSQVVGTVFTLSNVSTVKEVRDACTESMTAISQSGVSHLIQNDLYEALSTFNGAIYQYWCEE